MVRSLRFALTAALTLLLTLGAVGCSRQTVLSTVWPEANAERVVPAPPVPPKWPYTGIEAPDEAAIARRPLQVKIENSNFSRPQIGFSSADVVYETITEGGITRFNCIFHSTVPKTVGPVRSARLSDLWIVPQYHGLFFFSGASDSVQSAVNRADLPNLSQDVGVSFPYWRSGERNAPHNLMLDTAKAYKEGKKRGFPVDVDSPGLQFGRVSKLATPTVTSVSIPFSQANKVRWEYDSESRSYLRYNNGVKHRDASTGKQVSADNVVVLWARYDIASRDKVGSTTYDVDLGGKGRVSVFRGGARLDGRWEADRTTPPRFTDENGKPIRLAPGRTWFQVIPLDGKVILGSK